MSTKSTLSLNALLKRIALFAGIGLLALYVTGVVGGYLWLRYSRKIENVQLTDVALLRTGEVRKKFATQQFAQALVAWEAKNYREAYVYFVSAVRRDPTNIEGRLKAAGFLGVMGASNPRINMLEEGLQLAPNDHALNETLFTTLLNLGRNRRALELLHGTHAAALRGPNALFLQSIELQATLAVNGAPAAAALLNRYPELRQDLSNAPIVARVLWNSDAKAEAIAHLSRYVQAKPQVAHGYVLLAGWQRDVGQIDAAVATALAACQQFPGESGPRVLLFDVAAVQLQGTPQWWQQVTAYLRDFNSDPKAVFLLAELAGRRGWTELARTLYEVSAARGHDISFLGLFLSDALLKSGQVAEARRVLEDIGEQSAGHNAVFLQQLRQREITAAAAVGDRDAVRESARRLAGLVRDNVDAFDQYRQFYQSLGLKEAVTEFSETRARANAAAPAKS